MNDETTQGASPMPEEEVNTEGEVTEKTAPAEGEEPTEGEANPM